MALIGLKKKHDSEKLGVLSTLNFPMVMFIFSEVRSIAREHQKPVFAQKQAFERTFRPKVDIMSSDT